MAHYLSIVINCNNIPSRIVAFTLKGKVLAEVGCAISVGYRPLASIVGTAGLCLNLLYWEGLCSAIARLML